MPDSFAVEAKFHARDMMSGNVKAMASRMGRATTRMRAGLSRVDRAATRVSAGMRRVAASATVVGAAAGFAAREVIGTGAEFEQAITDVGAVGLKSRDQIAGLEAKALELGASTKFTAAEVARGMEQMAKAGLKTPAITEGIAGVLAAAAASGEDLAETSATVLAVMKGMGPALAKSTNEVADILALASASTASTVGSLGESMKNAAPVAKQFGISLTDTVASVALLQDVGIDASTSGSAFATMLTKLAKPTKAMRGTMKKLGVEFEDVHGNMLPFPQVLENFSKASKEAGGNMDSVAFFADLVGLRGQKAALNLKDLADSVDENGKKVNKVKELSDALAEAEGKAAEMAKIRMDTTAGDWLKFGAAVDGLKVQIFGLNNGALRVVIQDMTKWVTANKDVIATKIQDFIYKIVDALPQIVEGVTKVAKGVAIFYAVSTAVKVAEVSIAVMQGSVWALGVAWKATAWSAGMFNKALGGAPLQFFTLQTKLAGVALGGLRTSLNASRLAGSINSIATGALGKAGMLGAALGVGVAIGMWLDSTFKLSDKLTEILEKMAEYIGLKEKVEKKPPPGHENDRVYADGTVLSGDGEIVKKGDNWRRYAGKKQREGDAFEGPTKPGTPTGGASEAAQVQSPQDRTARTISENRSTTDATVTIHAPEGRAEITKAPGAGSGVVLATPASGGF